MRIHHPTNKKGGSKKPTTGNKVSSKPTSSQPTFQFADNRPVAQRQRQIQEMANQFVLQKKNRSLTSSRGTQQPVVQRVLTGESSTERDGAANERYKARKRETEDVLGKAPKGGAANEVHALVYSGTYGKLGYFSPPTERDREADPVTEFAKTREGGKKTDVNSKDGELYLIDKIEGVLKRYWYEYAQQLMAGHVTGKPGAWERHWIPNKKPLHDEIRIEIIGPKGTCTDCQSALGKWVAEKKGVFDKKKRDLKRDLGTLHMEPNKGKKSGLVVNEEKRNAAWGKGQSGSLKFSLITRWTGEQVLTGMRPDSKRHQSHQYGTDSAAQKAGVKNSGGGTSHYKLKIT